MQTHVPNANIGNQAQPQYQTCVCQPVQPQAVQVLPPQQSQQYAGVNIQIFNPAIGAPLGGATVNGVGSNGYGAYGTGLGGCYPSNYYTQSFNPNGANGVGGAGANGGVNGNSGDVSQNGAGVNGANGNGGIDNATAGAVAGVNGANGQNGQQDPNGNNVTNTTTNKTVNETVNKETDKKTEKRKIVQLTDNYIRTLENYLNSQDTEVRMMGAKEIVARLQEDDSRRNDKALTALTNKMLQDPSQQIRIIALSLLDSRAITGDDTSVKILQKMQQSQDGYGQDALSATSILLKMSGKTVEKEFEVKEKPKKSETKTETKTETKAEKAEPTEEQPAEAEQG